MQLQAANWDPIRARYHQTILFGLVVHLTFDTALASFTLTKSTRLLAKRVVQVWKVPVTSVGKVYSRLCYA